MTTPTAQVPVSVARQLFAPGTTFIGPEELRASLGLDLDPAFVPPIQFSEAQLVKAVKRNAALIFFVSEIAVGKPLTIVSLCDHFANSIHDHQLIQTSNKREWYWEDFSFTKTQPRAGWRLVDQECIPNSFSANYAGQTEVLSWYVSGHVSPPSEASSEAIGEWEASQKSLKKLVGTSSLEASQRLCNTKLNSLFRELPVELFYQMALRFFLSRQRLFQDRSVWTAARASGENMKAQIINLGMWGKEGILADSDHATYSDPDLGACLSQA